MLRFPAIIAAFAVCSLTVANAQRLPPAPNPNPSSASEALSEPILNPIRNTPAGREPLSVPSTAVNARPASVPLLEQCQTKLNDATYTVDNWTPSMRKSKAIDELKGARVALLAGDPRTCGAHIDKALSPDL